MNQPMRNYIPAPKTSYDLFIARLVANAVKELELQTGRKVASLSFPTPNCFEKTDHRSRITVDFVGNES